MEGRNMNCPLIIGGCPRCKDDAYELSSATRVTKPKEGQRGVFFTKLSCGCTVKEYMVWFDGWL
jgi:hypothetical protein